MTKKDYVAIAAVLAAQQASSEDERISPKSAKAHNNSVWCVACDMSDMLQRDNPRFDRTRFLQACAAKVKE